MAGSSRIAFFSRADLKALARNRARPREARSRPSAGAGWSQ